MGRAVGTLRVWRADHRLRRAPRDAGRASRAADGHRVRAALRAIGQRRPRDDLRPAAATGLGPAGLRGTRDGCAPLPSSSAASWATTPTTPPTSSTSPASAIGWRRVMRRDLRRGRDLQGLHWQCRVCRTLALWGAPSETAVTVLSSRGRSSNNRGCNALAPAGGVWRGRPRQIWKSLQPWRAGGSWAKPGAPDLLLI